MQCTLPRSRRLVAFALAFTFSFAIPERLLAQYADQYDPNVYPDLDKAFRTNLTPYIVGAAATAAVVTTLALLHRRNRPSQPTPTAVTPSSLTEYVPWRPTPDWIDAATRGRIPAAATSQVSAANQQRNGRGFWTTKRGVGIAMSALGAGLIIAGGRQSQKTETISLSNCVPAFPLPRCTTTHSTVNLGMSDAAKSLYAVGSSFAIFGGMLFIGG
jgi:hypothetical protein